MTKLQKNLAQSHQSQEKNIILLIGGLNHVVKYSLIILNNDNEVKKQPKTSELNLPIKSVLKLVHYLQIKFNRNFQVIKRSPHPSANHDAITHELEVYDRKVVRINMTKTKIKQYINSVQNRP